MDSKRLLLRLIAYFFVSSAIAFAAAANCPMKPGKWSGFVSGEVVAVNFGKEKLALVASLRALLEFEIGCDGKVTGFIRSGAGAFKAFSAGPSTKEGECTLGYSFHFKEGKVELGPDRAPILTIDAIATGRVGECSGDYADIARTYADVHGGVRFRFEAMYPRPENPFFGGSGNWGIEHNSLLRMPYQLTSAATARNYLWVLFPEPEAKHDESPKR